MALRYVHEPSARWDADKARLVGGAPEQTFSKGWHKARAGGELLPGDWWRIEDEGETVGYGWMDVNWGDAEILLVTDPERREQGVGSFILDTLGREARARGLNYMSNVIPRGHPEGAKVAAWLEKRGFQATEDGRLLRAPTPRPAQGAATGS